ncbi:MAG: hypothetical protein WEA77_11145 [Hyphomonas sp.]|uniref:hypothetical protein n=1 Tax=Hyphomonas sp. TaxID=87 RepID=UPI0034A09FA2
MSLRRITLQLARNPGLPAGDPEQGYLIIAPINDAGQLDIDAWRAERKACRVLRFHPDPAEKADGWLTHRGANWFFHYDEEAEGDDEAAFRFGAHIFREGEYITIRHADGNPQTYKVTDISPV